MVVMALNINDNAAYTTNDHEYEEQTAGTIMILSIIFRQ